VTGIAGLAILGIGATLSSVVALNGAPAIRLRACFSHVGGLRPGDEVTLNGVQVGRVSALSLDPEQRPCAELALQSGLELDLDTSASIFTKNVLGEKYVAIDPGGSDALLEPGDEIHYTQSALPLERLMIRMLENQLDATLQ